MGTLQISTNKDRLDIGLVHRFLSNEACWSRGIPREVVERAIDGSLCFGGYLDRRLVAFARVVTDGATFGYLADVFVVPEHRGQGHARTLMAAVMAHPELQGLRRFCLATRDAHGLYRQFAFRDVGTSRTLMEIVRPDPYRAA